MLVNVSNHPSTKAWPKNQVEAARQYGEVVDMPLPYLGPETTLEQTEAAADEYCAKICAMKPKAVLVNGESVFVFQLVKRLLDAGQNAMCTRSQRRVVEVRLFGRMPLRTSRYRFEAFVPYGTPRKQEPDQSCGQDEAGQGGPEQDGNA